MPNTLGERDWELLLRRIKAGKCTPFLGAGACFGVLPLGCDIAQKWAQEHEYPLEDCHDLARVAQYLAVTEDPMAPKEIITEWIKSVPPPNFTEPDEPHSVLAGLPLPVYITTNYDDFMVQALKSRNKDPKQELCRWNKYVKKLPSIFDSEPGFNPTTANPVVFHLHGHTKVPESLVLTEDDYLDFLVAISKDQVTISKDQRLLPARIEQAFAGASLLFLGYRIADWDFRVLFRILVSYMEISTKRAHVSVQLVPGEDKLSKPEKEKAQEYLDRYFGELKIRVYWGTCREFAKELRKRWEAFDRGN
ncbi:MAG: SIR2 family protein [Anaerolineales bacterium]|nr:MAG: SIR2 family protein [Anaerolineales bacterium]